MRRPLAFKYVGGKHRLAPWIVAHLPPHRLYVEPFAGSLAVLYAKPPSPVEVVNDLDEEIVAFYRVLRDPALVERLRQQLALTPYSRAEFSACRAAPPTDDPVERARRFFVLQRMGFGGRRRSPAWGYCGPASRGNAVVASYLHAIDAALPLWHERLRAVQIECDGWERIVDRYDGPHTLFYCDPPYDPRVRRDGARIYRHEFDATAYDRFIDRILRIEGAVALSSYPGARDADLVAAGFARHERRAFVSAAPAARRARGVDVLWVRPARARAEDEPCPWASSVSP